MYPRVVARPHVITIGIILWLVVCFGLLYLKFPPSEVCPSCSDRDTKLKFCFVSTGLFFLAVIAWVVCSILTQQEEVSYWQLNEENAVGLWSGENGPSSYVTQGKTLNCYIHSAVNSVAAQQPKVIRDMFSMNDDPSLTMAGSGKVIVRLYDHEKKKFVHVPVDDKVTVTNGNIPFSCCAGASYSNVFNGFAGSTKSGEPELYALFIEKAIAQYFGTNPASYRSEIWSQFDATALRHAPTSVSPPRICHSLAQKTADHRGIG